MPIPTDTFWNIKRLNVAFAASAIILLLTMVWSVMQDYDKTWRRPQQAARIWDAALTQEKMDRALSGDQQKRLKDLDRQLAEATARINAHDEQYITPQSAKVHQIQSDISTLSNIHNDRKSNVSLAEASLEAARTAGDDAGMKDWRHKLEQPRGAFSRQQLAEEDEKLFNLKEELKKEKLTLASFTEARDKLDKDRKKLVEDKEALASKEKALTPQGFLGHFSAVVRATPLLQFINPSEKPDSRYVDDVLTDLGGFKRVTTVDRCVTCHVNIAKKEFSENRVLAYLERQVAEERGITKGMQFVPKPPHADDPTSDGDSPGPIAMAEFWHAWGRTMLPAETWTTVPLEKDGPTLDTLLNKIVVEAGPLARPGVVSKEVLAAVQVAADQPALLTPAQRAERDKAVPALLLELYTRSDSMKEAAKGENAAEQKKGIDDALAAAVRYPEAVRQMIESRVSPEAKRLVLDRYRRALVAEVNAARAKLGEDKLDDGRVLLAHPNLRLYVDPDSKHPIDGGEGKLGMGCTSCHDGSGQETNFVLAAHMPRRIWVDEKTGEPVLPVQLKNPPAERHEATMSSMLNVVYPETAMLPTNVAGLHLNFAEHKEPASAEPSSPSGEMDVSAVETAPEKAPATEYADPVTGRTGRAVPQAKYWADKYEDEAGRPFELVYHEWDWPMRPHEYLQANCVRCHTAVTDVQEFAPEVNEGRLLFTQLGCVNCHNMESIPQIERRQVGTDLRHVTSKLSPEYINTWIFAPKSFRPSTKMPHFFLLENNSSDEELRRTQQEARAITEYLVRTATPLPPKHAIPQGIKGDPKEGEKLFRSIGCMGCHTNLNIDAPDPENPGQTIEGVSVAEQWITQDLIKKGDLARELRPKVAADTTKRLTEGLADKVRDDLKAAAEDELKGEVSQELSDKAKEELWPKDDAGKPKKLSKDEDKKVKAEIAADVKKKLPAALKEAKKTRLKPKLDEAEKKYDAALVDARQKLPGVIADTIESDLADKVKEEAKRAFDGMTYNERQIYVLKNLDAPHLVLNTPPNSPEEVVHPPSLPRYPDGSLKPSFVHHGPELSGVGTKLLDHRTPEQARAWLFDWLKEPRHYSSYTVMPNLRLSDQEAMNLVEHLLAQKRDTIKTYDTSKPVPEGEKPKEIADAWAAGLGPVDSGKLIELTAFFLRSRYSAQTATRKADDVTELKNLAVDALTSSVHDAEAAKADVEAILQGAGQGPSTRPIVALASADPSAGATAAAGGPITQPSESMASAAPVAPKDELRMIFLGKKLIGHYGCMSCHAIHGTESLTSPCADLSDWGQKQVSKLDYAYLDPHKIEESPPPAHVMMVNGLSAEASHLAHTNLGVQADVKAGAASPAASGRIAATVEVGWPELEHTRDSWITQKLKNTRIYDRGRTLLEPGPDNVEDPAGKPYDKLKMPTFYLTDDQVHAIVTFVLSNRDRLVSERMLVKANTEAAKQIAYGRFLTEKYNCIGCHQTEKNVPLVQQYYKPDELTQKAPPSLRGEGNRIQHDWLVYFLHHVGDVGPMRPLLQPAGGIRMPQFPIDLKPEGDETDDKGEEAKAIAAYFAAASNRESGELKRLVDPIRKWHRDKAEDEQRRAREAAKTQPSSRPAGTPPASGGFAVAEAIQPAPPGSAATQPANTVIKGGGPPEPVRDSVPADDWFRQPTLVETARVLKQWALEAREMTDRELDPYKNPSPGALETNFGKLLFKAEFLADLYDAPFPFVDKGNRPVSDEAFKKGEQLFYNVKCTQCHTITPNASNDPSAQRALVGPNLGRVPARIQRRWARYWIQEPATVQIDTKMIPFFSGVDALRLRGVTWHPPLPEDANKDGKTRQVDAPTFDLAYGATAAEQIEHLLDYIYGAPQRAYIAPAADAPDAPKAYVPLVEVTAPATQPTAGAETKRAGDPSVASGKPTRTDKPAINGSIKLKGKPPAMPVITAMNSVKECIGQHKDPPREETIVADDQGNLANVVVYVSSGLTQPFAPPKEPAVLEQKGCQYLPHVLPVMVGQPLAARNDDGFLHNVHTLPQKNDVSNQSQPTKQTDILKPVTTAEVFKAKCDVHPWMSAWIVALDNPFFGASAEDGTYAIQGLPPGKYTLTAWHESLGQQKKEVTVTAGEPVTVDFEFTVK